MDDEKISLRIGSEELEDMDAFLKKHPELGSRSLFIRTAVREYINRDADVQATSKTEEKNVVSVRFTEAQLAALDALVGTMFVTREAVVWKYLSPLWNVEGMAEEKARMAFQLATSDMTP